ncbi:MAG: nucleotidyltransferase [Defluviitaleaceae bacterium]|nr:nucleotidyltransferase [Defluviitaleaceae bacterium]
MKVTGIVSEYNPFHNGHKLHVETARISSASDYVIAVMSGNFVQRGEPAIFDKHLRTKAALLNGVDLVLEIPFFAACAAGEYFAEGAIKVLNATNITNSLCFGSECGDIDLIKKTANMMLSENKSVSTALRHNLATGMSFPDARARAFAEADESARQVLESPNNILAVEYVKAINLSKSRIEPCTIKRVLADYHSEQILGEVSSATAVRKAMLTRNISGAFESVPENTRYLYQEALANENIAAFDNLSHIFHYIIKTKSKKEIAMALDISEGIENRIIAAAEEHYKISDIMQKIKTKRYTMSKIRRIILQIILGISKENFAAYRSKTLPYIRVLGFKKSSENLLKELYRESSVHIITNLKQAHDLLCSKGLNMLEYEMMTSDIYYISQNSYSSYTKRKNIEYGIPLVVVP